MGALTGYLQDAFERLAPKGWACRREAPFLSADLERRLGYRPRADVLLERSDGSRRLWIEFEVSRADPVANHVKFAAGHLFQPQADTDSFISMVSPHVTPGRRNLAAHTIGLMRRVGMSAFQTPLFPLLEGDEIKRLNHLERPALDVVGVEIRPELDRAMAVGEPVWPGDGHRIAFAANTSEVMANVWNWNAAMETEEGRRLWGRRTVTYFVYEPHSRSFAPSKYCAFMAIESGKRAPVTGPMRMELYSELDESETRFDGHIARKHLDGRLGMTLLPVRPAEGLGRRFADWNAHQRDFVSVHPRGATVIVDA
jgi:hypothetical protein